MPLYFSGEKIYNAVQSDLSLIHIYFEYFSEDPVLAGVCGVSVCRGAEENNPVTACPKHFAVNEQETYRRGSARFSYDAVDSVLTERAARELYLKPFEMAVKGSHVHTFMSSFNKINGTFAGGSYDLCIRIPVSYTHLPTA